MSSAKATAAGASRQPGPDSDPHTHPSLARLVAVWCGTTATAVLVAATLALMRPLEQPLEWSMRTVLLALPVLLVGVAAVLLYPLRRWLGATATSLTVQGVVTIAVLLVGGALSVWTAKFEYPYTLLSPRGMALLALFFTLTMAAAVALGWWAGRSRALRRLGAQQLGALLGVALCFLFNSAGRELDPSPFWPLRYSNSMVLAVLVVASAALLRRVLSPRAREATVLAGGAVIVVAVAIWHGASPESAHRAYARLLSDGGNARRMVMLLRRLSDRDGNGYSARFDGGDCDEANPAAFPLGPVDCTHLLRPQGQPPPLLPQAAVPQVRRVLLATIDTFRCELDGVALCPDLERAAATASYSGWQRVFMGQTPRSLGALLGAPYIFSLDDSARRPSYTVERARANGYRAKAYYTIDILDSVAMAGSFDERDDELGKGMTHAQILETVFAGRQTERVIADLEAGRSDAGRSLRWVHYLDPHETYVPTPEGTPAPWFRFDRAKAYQVEMLRTQAAVAHLLARARALGYDRDAAILVTGDHGENFHDGLLYHGTSSVGEDLDVPVFAWVFDATGKPVKVDLPGRIYERDVAGLLAALLGVPVPPLQSEISMVDANDSDRQLVVTDGRLQFTFHQELNYEELFDRVADPACRHNLAWERPADVARLRERLSQQLFPFAVADGVARGPAQGR